jgi:hypothetical protein
MPYDEGVAERLRHLLPERPGVTDKKMFRGLASCTEATCWWA